MAGLEPAIQLFFWLKHGRVKPAHEELRVEKQKRRRRPAAF
jgi:hypothetical protein